MKDGRRCLLLNLPGTERAVSSVSVNLGIASIGAELRRRGVDLSILDLNLYGADYTAVLLDYLWRTEPDMVGFGMCTPQWGVAQEVASIVKRTFPHTRVVAGGPHPTVRPDEVLLYSDVDVVAVGEAEATAGDIISAEADALESVPGIRFKRGTSVVRTASRPRLSSLDSLPLPALDLFEVARYVYPAQSCKQSPVALIETSRGCPGRCSFCCRSVAGRSCRFKTPRRVVDEIVYAKSIGFNEVHFADDNFTTDMDRAAEICDLLIEHDIGVPWVPRSGIRVDYVSAMLLEKMRIAGCYHLPFGVESTAQHVLDSCGKGVTVNQIRDAILLAKSFGFEVTAYFMVGLPGQSATDIRADIEFARSMGIDFVKFGTAMPYPGTRLYRRLQSAGLIITTDWTKYHYATAPFEVYSPPELSVHDLERIEVGGRPLLEVVNQVLGRDMNAVVSPPEGSSGGPHG